MRYIELSDLKPGMVIGKDITAGGDNTIIKQGAILNEEYIARLTEHGCKGAYISEPRLSHGEVILSTGAHATIVRQTYDPERPIVRLSDSRMYINLTQDDYKDVYIVSGIERDSEQPDDFGVFGNLSRPGPAAKNAPRVMLVDDSVINLQQASQALADEGYNIIALQSGVAALNYIKDKGAPDLIVMDIMMPNVSGISAVSTIRKLGYNDLPVIFLTAKGDRETIMKCASVRAKDYIIKPIQPDYLRDRVARALGE